MQLSLYKKFIDFEKAFDRISTERDVEEVFPALWDTVKIVSIITAPYEGFF